MSDVEIPLLGGDVTDGIVRVGGTVRRPRGDHSALVKLVLEHLERVGFEGAPRYLGRDSRGRDVLSFVEGEVAGRPWPAWVADEDRAVSVAKLLRRLDDTMAAVGLPDTWPVSTATVPGLSGRPGPSASFIGHRDVTPENTVFRGGRAAAFIDFDLVRASTRVDEVGNLLLWWGGWMAPRDREPVLRDADAAQRGRVLVDAYGLDADDRARVVPMAIVTADRTWHSMRHRATTHGGGWARMWADGLGDKIRRRERWLRAHQTNLTAALIRE